MKNQKLYIYEAIWNLALFITGAFQKRASITLAIVLFFTCIENYHSKKAKNATSYIPFIWGIINSAACIFYFSFFSLNAVIIACIVMLFIAVLLSLEIKKLHVH